MFASSQSGDNNRGKLLFFFDRSLASFKYSIVINTPHSIPTVNSVILLLRQKASIVMISNRGFYYYPKDIVISQTHINRVCVWFHSQQNPPSHVHVLGKLLSMETQKEVSPMRYQSEKFQHVVQQENVKLLRFFYNIAAETGTQ